MCQGQAVVWSVGLSSAQIICEKKGRALSFVLNCWSIVLVYISPNDKHDKNGREKHGKI